MVHRFNIILPVKSQEFFLSYNSFHRTFCYKFQFLRSAAYCISPDIGKPVRYPKKISCEIILRMQIYLFRLSNLNQLSLIHNSNLISKNVSIILGSYGSGVSIAASDTFAQAKIPAVGVTCTNPQITEGNDHYFRICFLDPFQGTVLANFAKDELKAEKVYCLGQLGNDYDQGLMNYFKQAAEKLGMECVVESFPKNNSDFTSYLTTAKNEGADVIFAPTSISYAQLIVEQAAAQGIDMPLLASDTWDSNVILGAAKGKDVKVYVTTFYAEGGNAEFEKGFKEWIKSDSTNLSNNGGNDIISAVSVMGYDAYYTALEALKAAGTTNPQDVMAALPGVKYTGITGEISFNEEGDANRDSAFVKTANTESGLWDFVTVQGIDGAQ